MTAPAQISALADHRRFVRLGLLSVALSFGAFGGFAALAPLDSAAIAPGRVAVETNRKPIQHLEGGIVREILVQEAEKVSEGQVLFRLEPTQARAAAEALRKQIDALRAIEARLAAEQARATEIDFPADLLARRAETAHVAGALADQQRQFDERRRSLDGQSAILQARIDQTSRDLAGKVAQLASLEGQVASLEAEHAKISPLVQKGYYPVNKHLAMQRDLMRLKGDLGRTHSEVERGHEVIREAELQLAQAGQKLQEEVAQQIGETRARLAEAREKVAVAEDVLSRVEVRAPRAGIVQALKVFAAGSVVRPGETLAELVPVDDRLIVVARVTPLDVDNVTRGHKASVRFPAFSSRTTSPVAGEVISVSADALLDEATRQPYYAARVMVDAATMPKAIAERLVPGMAADVLIATGERTLLQYLVGPLLGSLSKGLRDK